MDLSNEGRLPGVEERQIPAFVNQGAERFANDQMALAQSCQALLKEARSKPKRTRNGSGIRISQGAGSVRSKSNAEPNSGAAKEILAVSFEDIFGCCPESSLLNAGNLYEESARMLDFLNRSSQLVGH
jgi:hypothetical protein